MLYEEVERPAAFVVETDFINSDAGRLLTVVNNSTDSPGCLIKILPEAQLIRLVIVATDFPCVT